jgi:hypothetical protein
MERFDILKRIWYRAIDKKRPGERLADRTECEGFVSLRWHSGNVAAKHAMESLFLRHHAPIVLTWVVLAAAVTLLAWPHARAPGLFYDEAVQVGAAKDLITGRAHEHYPGYRAIDLGGRPVPLFIQSYYGALKAWMLVPAFTLGGFSLAVFRLASLAWGLVSLLLFMLWVNRWQGNRLAIVAGTLLAFDPAWFFSTIMDWGPVLPGFVCKFLMFDLALRWHRGGDWRHAFAAASCAGLGFFAKVDFAVVVAGTGLAAALATPGLVTRIRSRPGVLAAAAAGFLLGALPMLANVPGILAGLGGGDGHPSAEWPEKVQAFLAMYDGSYFRRVMACGGVFTALYEIPPATASPFSLAVVGSLTMLIALAWRNRLPGTVRQAAVFTALSTVLVTAGTLGTPGAVRLHHTISVYPFPHLAVAMAVIVLFDRSPILRSRAAARLLLAAAIPFVLLAGNLLEIRRTQALVQATGGRGWWSDSLDRFCAEVRNRDDLTIVSLDWGFNEQLLALTDKPRLVEPIWAFVFGGRIPERLPAEPGAVYLLHPERYGHFPFNAVLLAAARGLPPDQVDIRAHRDRENEIAFYSVRFVRP